MARSFNRSLDLQSIADSLEVALPEGPLLVESICDVGATTENSICAYTKGRLPDHAEGLVVLAAEDLQGYKCVVVNQPRAALEKIINHVNAVIGFAPIVRQPFIHQDVAVGKNVVIENNVRIGQGTVIAHNTVIHSGTVIGERCNIGSNVTIGAEGFGYGESEWRLTKFSSLGGVLIGDLVDIGSNSTIARGNVDATQIEDGVKIDTLVNIAHDCHIGENATITASSAFCGYVSVGRKTRVAPNATLLQRVVVGQEATIGLGAVVISNVEDGQTVFGNPARKTISSS